MNKLCLLLLVNLVYAGGASAAEQEDAASQGSGGQARPKKKPQVIMRLKKTTHPDGTIVEERTIDLPAELATVFTKPQAAPSARPTIESPSDPTGDEKE